MRFLIVGAGALGGYFGGRLLAAAQDVTFLVRPRRAMQLRQNGLQIVSPRGDINIKCPPLLLSEQITEHYDVIIVGCKAYDLDATMDSFAAAVGPDSVILPMLNGLSHIEALSARFGAERVLGGLCLISSTLDEHGAVHHLNDLHGLIFGELNQSGSSRVEAIAAAMASANFDHRISSEMLQEMLEKWIFIATLSGATCLLRGSVGDIVASGQTGVALALQQECSAIATQYGFAPRAASIDFVRARMTAEGSPLTASMLKDLERGDAIESDHIIGDFLRRGQAASAPTLAMAYAHLKTYEARRDREAASK